MAKMKWTIARARKNIKEAFAKNSVINVIAANQNRTVP